VWTSLQRYAGVKGSYGVSTGEEKGGWRMHKEKSDGSSHPGSGVCHSKRCASESSMVGVVKRDKKHLGWGERRVPNIGKYIKLTCVLEDQINALKDLDIVKTSSAQSKP